MADRHDIPDDFWDLSSILPKKRPPVMRERKPDVETVPIDIGVPDKGARGHDIGSLSVRFREVDGAQSRADVYVRMKNDARDARVDTSPVTVASAGEAHSEDSLRLPPRESLRSAPAAELIDEYEPEGGLLRRVRVMRWPSRYSFYEQFRHDAKRYYSVSGVEAPAVDFFSYTPQYRQMTKAQLAYYFWWRENAVRGVWLPASFSYILLYIYEIINLHEVIPPTEGLRRLVGVWLACRDKHRVLDKYLSEWVADYCLIHRLPPPREELAPIMSSVMEAASFREFYMSGGSEGITAETLIDLSSDYNWRRSKFAVEDGGVAAAYARHIPAAVAYVADKSGDARFSTGGMSSAVVSRDAFCGSLCAHNVKCRIDIEYLSYTRSRELRSLLTELVKYCENRLRAALGIRARLRVNGLDSSLSALADEYFDREFPEAKKPVKLTKEEQLAAEERRYDAEYDALSHGVDSRGAAEIERASWASTDILAPEDEPLDDAPADDENVTPLPAADEHDGGIFSRLDADAAEYLRLSLSGGGAGEYCRAHALYEDELVSRINEISADVIGDIILEPDGNTYRIVEDYRDDIK